MGGDEARTTKSTRESEENFIGRIIEEFYKELLKYDYKYDDLYEMNLIELENSLISKRQGLAYNIWRLATFIHSPLVKNFPTSPKEAMPELYPIEKGIPMPDFLKEKAMKRGVI